MCHAMLDFYGPHLKPLSLHSHSLSLYTSPVWSISSIYLLTTQAQTNTPKRRHTHKQTHTKTHSRNSQTRWENLQPWKNKNYYILWDRHQIIVGPCCQDNREKLFKWQNDIGCSKSRGFSLSSFPVPKAKSVLLSKQKSSFGNVFLLN